MRFSVDQKMFRLSRLYSMTMQWFTDWNRRCKIWMKNRLMKATDGFNIMYMEKNLWLNQIIFCFIHASNDRGCFGLFFVFPQTPSYVFNYCWPGHQETVVLLTLTKHYSKKSTYLIIRPFSSNLCNQNAP